MFSHTETDRSPRRKKLAHAPQACIERPEQAVPCNDSELNLRECVGIKPAGDSRQRKRCVREMERDFTQLNPPHEVLLDEVVDLCTQLDSSGAAPDDDNVQQARPLICRHARKCGCLDVADLRRRRGTGGLG